MNVKFETLEIWKKSVDFAAQIYDLTKTFPKAEMFSLTTQLTRAAVSISLNIAEVQAENQKLISKDLFKWRLDLLTKLSPVCILREIKNILLLKI